jgi:hypothetical protein
MRLWQVSIVAVVILWPRATPCDLHDFRFEATAQMRMSIRQRWTTRDGIALLRGLLLIGTGAACSDSVQSKYDSAGRNHRVDSPG